MFQRLHSSSSYQGYKPLGGDALSNSVMSPELSGHGGHTDGVPPSSRCNTVVAAKSYGDLKSIGRARGKKTRAMKWLVLQATGERQIFTLDKRQLIQTCRLEIPIRDMRLMDSALGNETLAQLLVRDNALVFSMEHVRLIIMHDKVVVPLEDGGLQPPGPPFSERPASAAATPELKDRFLAHLEMVVMDWALQHGSTLPATIVTPHQAPPSQGAPQPQQQQQHPTQPPSQQPGPAPGASNGGLMHPPAQAGPFGSYPAPNQPPPPQSGTPPHPEPNKAQPPPRCGAAGAGAAVGGPLSAVVGAVGAAGYTSGGGGVGGGQASVGGPGSETASTNAFDPEYQPFEMLVLETALSEICTHLSREVDTLQMSCQPALEALMKTADTVNLEAVRRVKTYHARLVTRVTATREALERLMEDDDDMVRMCLTQQAHMRLAAVAAAAAASQQHSHQHSHQSCSALVGSTIPSPAPAAPAAVTAVATLAACQGPESPPSPSQADAHQLAMLMGSSISASYIRPASLAARAVRHQAAKKPGGLGEALAEAAAVAAAAAAAGPGNGGVASSCCGGNEVMEHDFLDVENLLESYAIIVDTTYQTLMTIGEYIDDTEDLINIQLDYSRNKLIRFDILLTSGTFALAFFNIVAGMLGENLVLPDAITQDLSGFILVNGATMVFCIATFLSLVAVFKWQKVL